MGGRLIQLLLALSLLLNAFVLAGFVYRSWVAPPFPHHVPASPPPPSAGPGQGGGPLEQMANDLGLDDKQRQALRDVFDKYQADRRKRFQEIQGLREQTGNELRKREPDWAKVDGLIDQLVKLRGDAQKENLRSMLALEPHLTPQQRDKLHDLLAERYINPPRSQQRQQGQRPGSGPGRDRPTQ